MKLLRIPFLILLWMIRRHPLIRNLVVIESPYAGEVEENERYARAAVADCLQRGENPYASHLFFTQPGLLDDTVPEEREKGIRCGFAWGVLPPKRVLYVDRGISGGMNYGVDQAPLWWQKVEKRQITEWESR